MKKMNTYLILGILCLIGNVIFMVLSTREGRKKALAETEKNLVEAFNDLDSIGRSEFISNAKLNKDEIIVQINNQTVSSATEIIGEVRGKFGIIQEDLNIKGEQINSLNVITNPIRVAEDQKNLKLKEFLKIISELIETNSNSNINEGIYDFLTYNRFDEKQLPLLKQLLELSKGYTQYFNIDWSLRDYMLITIFRDFPEELLNNYNLYEEYTQRRLTKILTSGFDSKIIKRGLRKNIEKLYENGNFITQDYFKDVNSFCQHIDWSQELSDFTYQLVKSREEKFYLYKKYYLNHLKSQPNKNLYWGKSLKNEFGKELTNEEKILLKNIK